MLKRGISVAVVMPAYYEEQKIGAVVRKLVAVARTLSYPLEIVVVDDGSTDCTADAAAAEGARVLRHPENRGAGAAIRTGMEWAIDNDKDYVAVMAGDDQHVATELPLLVEACVTTGADLVQGSRWLPGGAAPNISMFRSIFTRVYSLIFSILTRSHMGDPTNGLRVLRCEMIADYGIDLRQTWLDRYELEPYLLYQSVTRGAHVVERPCTVNFPATGKSYTKMVPVRDWWRILRPMVLLAMGIKR